MRKANKNNDFIQKFLLLRVILCRAFARVPRRMGVHSSACKQAAAHPGSTSECRLLHQQHYTHASWYSCEHTTKNDTEEKKLLNKVVIFVFFAHKKYSRSFITLRLYHWCHMDYFNDVLTTFLGLQRVSFLAVYGGSESSRISSKIS